MNEENGKISDPGINKMILLKSQDMYKTLINYICNNEIKTRHLLARGLGSVPYITRFFDSKWYENYFIFPMRDILLNFPIVWNGKQYVRLTEIYLPIIGIYNDIDEQKKAYSLIAKLYNYEVPTFEESKNFEKRIWENDNRIIIFPLLQNQLKIFKKRGIKFF